MTCHKLLLLALLLVATWGLSFSPSQMEAIEFQPKKACFERKKEAVKAYALPVFERAGWLDCPVKSPVLPLPSLSIPN